MIRGLIDVEAGQAILDLDSANAGDDLTFFWNGLRFEINVSRVDDADVLADRIIAAVEDRGGDPETIEVRGVKFHHAGGE